MKHEHPAEMCFSPVELSDHFNQAPLSRRALGYRRNIFRLVRTIEELIELSWRRTWSWMVNKRGSVFSL